MAPSEIVTVSDIEATSPPPPLDAVVDAIACAVSSYCSRVGGFDEDEQATRREPKVSQVMRFMGRATASGDPEKAAFVGRQLSRACKEMHGSHSVAHAASVEKPHSGA